MALPQAIRVFAETLRHIKMTDNTLLSHAEIKHSWATKQLEILATQVSVIGTPTTQRPAIFVGNHISYLDVLLLLSQVPDLSFVAKKELASWPIFGRGMKKAETIFVQRNSPESRAQVKEILRKALLEERKGMAVFPSGTTTLFEEKPWKNGSFRLAEELQVPLQAFRISYYPLRKAAFIDDDSLPVHLIRLLNYGPIYATIEFAEPVMVKNAVEAREWAHQWCRNGGMAAEELSRALTARISARRGFKPVA
ncbi:MAG TPA: lysophospholipid acyltransferase family protein [Bdellovibrionota bacterium]|jgi:1-acyl-sn-glycerol-3-phosphate acyltransferase